MTSSAAAAAVEPGPLWLVAPNIWVAASHHSFVGLHIGTRMTIVRLSSGGLWMHSPIALSPELVHAIAALGTVEHIVCPNLYHHLYATEAVRTYPDAQLHGPARLATKRKDLHFTSALSEQAPAAWSADLVPITIDGSMLGETVFFHPASRTLITSDLVENFSTCDHGFTRLYLRLGGVLGKVGWHPLLRPLYRNRKAARASIDRILELPFETVIVAHGDVLTDDAKARIRAGLAWL